MLIGELSKKTGITRHTIRFYEKQGLISAGDPKSLYNNYKDYSEETLKRILAIKRIKGFGFTLNEVMDFLEMIEENQASCKNVSKKFEEKITLIDQKIEELNALKKSMISEVEECPCCTPETADEKCPIFI